MTTSTGLPARQGDRAASPGLVRLMNRVVGGFSRIPHDVVALLARFSLAAVFWNSGQTKIQGLAINFVTGDFHLGWPHLSDSAIALFQDEYKLPFLSPEVAAPLAALGEHTFALMLLFGLGTRFAALGLLGMTLVIEVFVYPGAYATHGTWAALCLFLMSQGPGRVSIDRWLAGRRASRA